ncbi:acetyltransferase [Oceanobacillus oncorhynchi subsp. incaldanensis]|uniref:acetyltransferase n=1 Tax=Oceanobacillus oncorhynchi TaxID=545501 RepID=UPI001B066CBC|nr:acetyltransferase [Oceanobacillus oncorhynchi]GIO19640.1 acetyltransferase [Oceanobacillus oncorhynchi subsp. incaldanensis]
MSNRIMNDKNKLLIIGASGHGKVIADIALKRNEWNEIAFLDDDKNKKELMGLKVIGNFKDIINFIEDYHMFVGIGNNQVRERIFKQLEEFGAVIPILIHPSAVLGTNVNIEKGSAVMAGAVINCDTQIGKGCIINSGSTIDHDNNIADFVHISPGAHLAGTVKIGLGSWIGIGATISNNLSIVDHCTIGAGSVVIRHLEKSGTYAGVPTRRIST